MAIGEEGPDVGVPLDPSEGSKEIARQGFVFHGSTIRRERGQRVLRSAVEHLA
jgi:hypothetical protein